MQYSICKDTMIVEMIWMGARKLYLATHLYKDAFLYQSFVIDLNCTQTPKNNRTAMFEWGRSL